ncbi:MAG: MmgE/PrpD family protein [Dongiaceae bacterium]
MTRWVTNELAEYAVGSRFSDYPAEVVAKAKLLILDNLGCMMGGVQSALGQAMLRALMGMGEGGNASAVGTRARLRATDAALFNGTTANALDYDETLEGIGHPSSSVIPAALAAGEDRGIDGKRLIDAILVGYDVGNRVGRAIQPTYERLKRVWCVGTWQTMGAVASAAKAIGLNLEQTLNAYGTAGATAPLPNTQKWGWELSERPIHWAKEPTGWPSSTGTLAALLAEQGFVGNRFILDGEKGFWAMAGSDRCDFDAMTRNLGTSFEVLGLSIKPYSCCRWQHAALDCIVDLKNRYELMASQVEAVAIYSFDWVQAFQVYGPRDMVDAEFSFPHSVTMLLHGVEPGPAWFDSAALNASSFSEYSKRVTVHLDKNLNEIYHTQGKIAARVELKLRSGDMLMAGSDSPLGSPEKPIKAADIEAKFIRLSEPLIGRAAANEIVDRVAHLEELRDIRELIRLTVGNPAIAVARH